MAVARDQLIDLGIGSGGPSLRLARYRDRVPANRVGALALARGVVNHCLGSERFGVRRDPIRVAERVRCRRRSEKPQQITLTGDELIARTLKELEPDPIVFRRWRRARKCLEEFAYSRANGAGGGTLKDRHELEVEW